jgi:hypothetical protein
LYSTLAWHQHSYALSEGSSIAHTWPAALYPTLPVSRTTADGTRVCVAFPLPALMTFVDALLVMVSTRLTLSAGTLLTVLAGLLFLSAEDLVTRGSASL